MSIKRQYSYQFAFKIILKVKCKIINIKRKLEGKANGPSYTNVDLKGGGVIIVGIEVTTKLRG